MKVQLAGCVIQDQHGRILLLRHNTPSRVEWELPGGKLEKGETYEVAAKREVKEELGIEVVISQRLGGAEFTREDGDFYYEWFAAKIISGTVSVQELHVHDQYQYFSLSEIDLLTISSNLAKLKQSILDGTVKI